MNLSITVNEAACVPPPATPGTFSVRAFYNEVDAGHLTGPFATRERAEECAVALASKPGVLRAVVEGA